jgi:transketolase
MTSLTKPANSSMRQAFARTLVKLAATHPDIYVVNIDLKSSLKLDTFAQRFKGRFIEVGVAEQNAAGVAAGLALSGKTVFLTSYAAFSPSLNWGVIRQSICYNQAKVIIVGSHAGLMTDELGATHQSLEDIALMRALPDIDVFSPADAGEVKNMLPVIIRGPHPAYLRLVRSDSPDFTDPKQSFTIGRAQVLKIGSDLTVVGHGPILYNAFLAQQELKNISLEIINSPSIQPLDERTILSSVKKTRHLITIEDHQIEGGLGEAIAPLLLKNSLNAKMKILAVQDEFGRSARDYQKLWEHYHLSTKDLIKAVKDLLSK